jgi:glycosyltransferase involved in cell wall biosynthesis
VTHIGALGPSAVAKAMADADLFVLPTLEDACALVVIEAMAVGLPVITTDQNGSGELVIDGTNGRIVKAGDVNGLARAIHELTCDPLTRIRMGEAACKAIDRTSTWENYGSRVLGTLDLRLRDE